MGELRSICRMLVVLLGFVLCAWAQGTALADAGREKIEDRLRNEPVSMWNFGLYRVSEKFSDWFDRKFRKIKVVVGYGVNYMPDQRRILLSLTFSKNAEYSRNRCRKLIEDIRLNAGIRPDGSTALGYSYYASFFNNEELTAFGWRGKDYLQEIDQLIYIEIRFVTQGSCEGPLVSKAIVYRDF